MSTAELELLELGVITKPHGVRGELKVQLHWSESTVLAGLETVFLSQPSRPREPWRVESVRYSNKGPLLRLAGVDSRETAESLRGARLSARRADLPPLEPGEYYLIDLLGCEVRAPSGSLGRVVEVHTHATLDTLVVLDASGKRREQPLGDSWIEEVNIEDRLVVLSSEDGLIDE